ncbi:MAG: tRNA pseudouridine(55) synthase TruB, partial [Micromonosporaceae bacterium]
DLGAALEVGGHLTALRRTRVGRFSIAAAVTLDALEATGEAVTTGLSEAAELLFARRDVTAEEAVRLSHGNPLDVAGIEGPYAVFDPGGQVLAVVRERDGKARPEVVFAAAGCDDAPTGRDG